jgi:PAS domain S-box-containing protein
MSKVFYSRGKIEPTKESLMASQEMYRDLVEMAHEGITMVDPNDVLTFVNRQFAKNLGYKASELIGRSLLGIATKESAVRIAKEMERRKKGLKSRYEVTLIHRDGSEKCFWLSASPVYGPSHEFIGSIGAYADMTEKNNMEMKLAKKVRQINVLYRVYGHARMAKSLGSMLKGIAQELVQAFPESQNAQCKLVFDRKTYLHPKKFRRFSYKIEVPLVVDGVKRGILRVGYGKKVPFLEHIGSLKEERELTKNVAKILCKHMYAREILGRHREIVKKSFTAIIIVRNHKIAFANPRFYRMFRCKDGQVVGTGVQNFFPNCRPENSVDGKVKEGVGKRVGGEIFDLALITQRISYNGNPAILIRINDTSALKKAQKRLDNFNSELQKIVKEKTLHLELANKRLWSLNQSKDEFIAITSHELRSPLTSIRGYLSFLVEEESINQISEPYREYLRRAYSTTDALNYLINNILDVSRLDMGRFELQKQEVDVIRLIRTILDSLSFQANEGQLMLEFDNATGKEKMMLEIDSIRMSQVLRNVLDNSIKFTKKGKKIAVTVGCDAQWLAIGVADQGVGIPKSKLNQVFDKFTQVRNTQTRYKGGVGLGLFIAKRIVELHGGKIQAGQNKDGGVTITIYLPRNH